VLYTTANIKELNIQTILSLVDELSLFSYYMGRNVEPGKVYNNPLRTDNNPSLSFYFSNGSSNCKIRFKDFATGETGSIFDFIMKKYNVSLSESLIIIDNDFSLGIRKSINSKVMGEVFNASSPIKTVDNLMLQAFKKNTDIKVSIRDWNNGVDKTYWQQYGITCKILQKYRVYPLRCYWINNSIIYCKNSSPSYGYFFGENKWKIYTPLSKQYRWISNVGFNIIQGYEQLPERADYLIITKSLKDIMSFDVLGYHSIAPQNETVLLSDNILKDLWKRFSRIILNFDYDLTGVSLGNKYRKLNDKYDILYFTDKYGSKDLSDYIKNNGLEKARMLIGEVEQKLKNKHKYE